MPADRPIDLPDYNGVEHKAMEAQYRMPIVPQIPAQYYGVDRVRVHGDRCLILLTIYALQLWHYAHRMRRLGKGPGDGTLAAFLNIVNQYNLDPSGAGQEGRERLSTQ